MIAAAGGQQFNVDAITALTLADFIATGGYDRHIRRMRNRYRRRRDHLVEALSGFDVGIRGLAAGVNMLLTLPDGAEPEVLRRAGEAGIALSGLALMRHPLAHPDIPAPDGIIVGFGAPADTRSDQRSRHCAACWKTSCPPDLAKLPGWPKRQHPA